jgi:TM2 domain
MIYCTACGMPHHEDCYQENGGCTVFGCVRAPADDPKVLVSYGDLQTPVQAQSTAVVPSPHGALGLASGSAARDPAAGVQMATVAGHPPKSRTTYIVLGIFLGAFGAHNFYAGYTGRAVGQLCLSVLTLFYLAIASWIWAVVEICIVDHDSAGIKFS